MAERLNQRVDPAVCFEVEVEGQPVIVSISPVCLDGGIPVYEVPGAVSLGHWFQFSGPRRFAIGLYGALKRANRNDTTH